MIPGGWELILIVVVLLLLFGAKKLPDMARSVGQSARVFKGEMKGMKADEEQVDSTDSTSARAETSTQAPAPAQTEISAGPAVEAAPVEATPLRAVPAPPAATAR